MVTHMQLAYTSPATRSEMLILLGGHINDTIHVLLQADMSRPSRYLKPPTHLQFYYLFEICKVELSSVCLYDLLGGMIVPKKISLPLNQRIRKPQLEKLNNYQETSFATRSTSFPDISFFRETPASPPQYPAPPPRAPRPPPSPLATDNPAPNQISALAAEESSNIEQTTS